MLVADTHVHVYPAYQAAAALTAAYDQLNKLCHRPTTFHAGLFLTERNDCQFFSDLQSNQRVPSGFRVETTGEPEVLALWHEQRNIRLLIFAGSQIVTSEGIELLCLVSTRTVASGLPAGQTLDLIRKDGGIPVVSWAPGKWWFNRGRVIQTIITSHKNHPLLFGDTIMRANGYPAPGLMKQARRAGIPVVAGTDPLPFRGDEFVMGTYGITSHAFNPDQPATSARSLLSNGEFIVTGRRNNFATAARRWLKNRAAGRS